MQIINYQKELDKLIKKIEQGTDEKAPTLFLHSCCAPCSSYVLKYLRKYFAITVFYYNPNISERAEYEKRVAEQKRLIQIYNAQLKDKPANPKAEGFLGYPIAIVEGDYDCENFYKFAAPLANCPEGGERCFLCYELRLRKTAQFAEAGGFDYFGTTLTISPLKNAAKLNEIGLKLEQEMSGNQESRQDGIKFRTPKWLVSDFKKKEGYKQSIELSHEYNLYRQDFCGCVYSKAERDRISKRSISRIRKDNGENIIEIKRKP